MCFYINSATCRVAPDCVYQQLEGEYGRVLPRPERVDDSLTDEQSHRDANSHRNHSSADVNAVTLRSDASYGGQAGLGRDAVSLRKH